MKAIVTVEETGAALIDVTTFGDLPGSSRYLIGEQQVTFRSRAGRFTIPWSGDLPTIGARFTIEVKPEDEVVENQQRPDPQPPKRRRWN